jgi:hypothetical protein
MPGGASPSCCLYQKLRFGRTGDEVRRESDVIQSRPYPLLQGFFWLAALAYALQEQKLGGYPC